MSSPLAPTALITGISGQTGSYLAELLAERGWILHGVGAGPKENPIPPETTFHKVNLLDSAGLGGLVREISPDVVVNLAAVSSVAQSWKEPELTARVNGLAVATLLDSVSQLSEEQGRIVKFIQASSGEMFSLSGEVPQNEFTRLAPSNPYGASKAYAHLLTQTYRARGILASSCILYNHESPRRPEAFVTRKITSSVARIAAGLQDKLVLGALDVKRDWGWAPDYAEAIFLMMSSPESGDYVVATGESHTVRDFVEKAFMAAGILDWENLVETDESFIRPTDSPELKGDASKIREELGWKPTRDFSAIVSKMVAHDLAAL
jgi:GDPmannose 4,6-dehydratase